MVRKLNVVIILARSFKAKTTCKSVATPSSLFSNPPFAKCGGWIEAKKKSRLLKQTYLPHPFSLPQLLLYSEFDSHYSIRISQ